MKKILVNIFVIIQLQNYILLSYCCLSFLGEFDNSNCESSDSSPIFRKIRNDTCTVTIDNRGNWISWHLECFDNLIKLTSTPNSFTCNNSASSIDSGSQFEVKADGSCQRVGYSIYNYGFYYKAENISEANDTDGKNGPDGNGPGQ